MATKQPLSPEQSADPHRPSVKSPSEQSTGLGKICFICYSLPDVQTGDFSFGGEPWRKDHCLFLLDLDAELSSGEAYVPVNPNICIDTSRVGVSEIKAKQINALSYMTYLGISEICVLGSTLYLFGRRTRDVFTYELSSSIPFVPSLSSPPLELTQDKLHRASPMNFPKIYPVGCQIPDGEKLLLFSTKFDVEHLMDGDNNGNFELFDRREGKWTLLSDVCPLIRCHWMDMYNLGLVDGSEDVHVRSYSLIDNGLVLLIVTELGNFTLDIRKNVWLEVKEFQHPFSGYYGLNMLVRGRLRLMDRFAWVEGKTDRYQWLSSYPYPSRGSRIIWLSSDHICAVRTFFKDESLQPHIVVDVCELNNRVETDDDVPVLKVKKSFKFVVGNQKKRFFSPKGLFSIT